VASPSLDGLLIIPDCGALDDLVLRAVLRDGAAARAGLGRGKVRSTDLEGDGLPMRDGMGVKLIGQDEDLGALAAQGERG
jgi:hypothetical protein